MSAPPPHPAPASASAAPLLCPLCNYNLTGLPTPQCPECGHRFEWSELTDPTRQKLKWLFEHRPTPPAYVKTQLRLLLPARFFRTLRPAHKLRPLTLIIFFLLGPIVSALPIASGLFYLTAYFTHQSAKSSRSYFSSPASASEIASFSSFSRSTTPPATSPTRADLFSGLSGTTAKPWLNKNFPLFGMPGFWTNVLSTFRRMSFFIAPILATLLIPPLVSFLILSIMRQSFARAKILAGHILRAAIYPSDFLALFTTFIAASILLNSSRLASPPPGSFLESLIPFLPFIAAALLWLYRFHQSLRLYLGIPRPWSVTLAAATIATILTLSLRVAVILYLQ